MKIFVLILELGCFGCCVSLDRSLAVEGLDVGFEDTVD